MKQSNLKFEREISQFIKNRRVKLLLTMYKLCVVMFTILIITDLFKNQITTVQLEIICLSLIILSYFIFYKRNQFEIASYFIIIILGFGIIMGLVLNEFNKSYIDIISTTSSPKKKLKNNYHKQQIDYSKLGSTQNDTFLFISFYLAVQRKNY